MTTSATTVTLTGTVIDALSGVASVTCNGVAATREADAWSCAVPLPPGRTPVVVHASDVAGGQASTGLMVTRTGTPTTLRITPDQRTLLVGQVSGLQAANEFTTEDAADVTWTSSDTAIVTIDAEADTLTAVGAGTATLTATAGSRSDTAQVTVVAGTELAMGTTLWQIDAPVGGTVSDWLPLQRVAPEVPDLVVQTGDGSGGRTLLFVQADGTVVGVVAASGTVVMADVGGGVLEEEPMSVMTTQLRRWPTVPGERPWQRTARSPATAYAQGPDGTVWFVEEGDGGSAAWLIGVEGATGAERARITLPTSTYHTEVPDPLCFGGSSSSQYWVSRALISDPVIDAAGRVRLQVRTETQHHVLDCDRDGPVAPSAYASALQLLTVTPDGAPTWTALAQAGPFTDPWHDVGGGSLLPTSTGGVVVSWGYNDAVTPTVAHVSAGDAVTVWPEGTPMPTVAGEDGVVYQTSSTLEASAIDPTTGNGLWTTAAGGTIVATMAGGHVMVRNQADGGLLEIDANGAVSTEHGAMLAGAQHWLADAWVNSGTGAALRATSDPGIDALIVQHGPTIETPLIEFMAPLGNQRRQAKPNQAPTDPIIAVRCRPVGNTNASYFGALHCYIVTRNRDDQVQTVDGGEQEGRPFGRLAVSKTPGNAKAPNRPTDPTFYVSEETPAAFDDIACIETMAEAIDVLQLPYSFLGPNSNSLVTEIMAACNRPVTLPPQAVGSNVPLGWWHQ